MRTTRFMVPLRRLRSGQYQTLDGRYNVERQDGVTDCEHPLCDPLHQRFHERLGPGSSAFVHRVMYVAWHVWDNQTDDYLAHTEYDTKREAHQALSSYLERTGGQQ